MVRHVFVFFVGRTGSTYLMQIFKSLYDCDVLCKYGEIFTTIEAIMDTFDAKNKLGINSENYRSYALENPVEYINFINDNASPDTQILFSKIQIPYLMSKDVNTINKILNYPNCELIIVKRNLLDAFISEKKARYVNRWSLTNTTNFRINIDPKEFYEYYCKTTGYYNRLISMINKPHVVLNYESIHRYKNNKDKINYILKQLKNIKISNKIDESKYEEKELLFRQDCNTKQNAKVLNYDYIQKYLIQKGLFKLLH